MPSKRSSAKLKQLFKLSRRKESLMAQIQDIDRAMRQLEQEFRKTRQRKKRAGTVTYSNDARSKKRKRSAR